MNPNEFYGWTLNEPVQRCQIDPDKLAAVKHTAYTLLAGCAFAVGLYLMCSVFIWGGK